MSEVERGQGPPPENDEPREGVEPQTAAAASADGSDAGLGEPQTELDGLRRSERHKWRVRRRRVLAGLRRWWWLWLTAAVLAGGFLWVGMTQARHHGRLSSNVSVVGVRLGGLTGQEARARLGDQVLRSGLMSARLRTPTGTLELPLERIGIRLDVDATVDRAARRGFVSLPLGLRLWVGGGGPARPVLRVDPSIYVEGLVVVRDLVDRPATDAALRLVAGRVQVVPAVDGVSVDDITLERRILASVEQGRPFDGEVPTMPLAPAVSTAQAEERAGAAAAYLKGPLVLRYRSRAVTLKPAQLAALLAVNTGADAAQFPLTFDNPRAAARLHRLFAWAEREPIDARVEVRGNQLIITRSGDGVALDMPALVADMNAAAAGGSLRVVFIRLRTVAPKYTTQGLQDMGLSALGSEFTTYYDPHNKTRAANIALAARLVDNTIVPPGKVFSLNETLGPRTLNRGFDYAPVIVGGVLRQGVGGGICQFATTLFNAVFFAGLPAVERHPHTFAIEHYPVGRDASVAWGGADFKFRNTSGHPLMIRCWASSGSLTIVIAGSTDRSVTYTTSPFRHVQRPHSSAEHPRVVYDDTLAGGVISLERGGPGYTVTVVRTVRENGALVFRDTFVSTYAPKDWIKRVGTRVR